MNFKSKKLIYILNSYSLTESSHFHHVLGLLEALAERGIKIVLIIEKADAIPTFSNVNITVIAVNKSCGLSRYWQLFKIISGLIRKGFYRTYVRIAAPSALVATLAHRIFGGSVYFWQSGTTIEYDLAQPISLKKLKWYLYSHIPNSMARKFVHYFVTGPAFMVDYYHRVGKVKREKIRLLYNDIDVERFSPPENLLEQKTSFLSARGLASDTLILLLVHRLSPVRRTQLYFPSCLDSLKNHGLMQRVLVVVAGSGDELPLIKEEVQTMGLADRCIFMGSVPNREIQQLYTIADVFLHPTYNEGFPRVVLEAMAAGLPIVSTDAGGTRELVGEFQSSFIVSRDDSDAFATCLEKMITDPSLRQLLSKENRSYVERFSTENVASMYEEVLFS
jgi:glycosyltransferase involved in cell wall biosynthesis